MDVNIGEVIGSLAGDPTVIAIYLMLLFSVGNFVIGSAKAWQNGSFELEAFDAWVRKDGGRLIPIVAYLLLGKAVSLVDVEGAGLPTTIASTALTGYGILQAGTFLLATLDSMREAITPNPTLKVEKLARADAAGDSIPLDE